MKLRDWRNEHGKNERWCFGDYKESRRFEVLIQIADAKDIDESREEIGKLSNVLRAKRL